MIQTDLCSYSYKKGTLVPLCKKCGAQHFYRDGKSKQKIQRYECRECGFRFVWTSDLPRRRCFSNIMSFAVELYTSLRKAISLKGVAEIIGKVFGAVFSHETIRQWTLAEKDTICRRQIDAAAIWHIDETYIKIKGKGWWLWIVYDEEYVLSWHLSKRRTINAARKVIRSAVQNTTALPEKIITDGLAAYVHAIKKEIGWNWREQKKRHIISSGIGKNALIERLNEEIKRRIHWFRTFQSVRGAKAFFALWFHHYNQKNTTPLT